MTIVIGGSHLNPRAAGVGGLLGGGIFAVLLVLATIALYLRVDTVAGEDMPMLAIVGQAHPALGLIFSLVIFVMIFNTALGLFYALAKRLARGSQRRFRVIYPVSVVVGFLLSFVGFNDLIGYVYPVVGYVGMALALLLLGVGGAGASGSPASTTFGGGCTA